MTTLHSLKAPHRSTHRKKRVGRGQGSGLGKTAGRGGKGQKARTGNMRFEGFEGGQSPLQRRLPKFGFNAPNRLAWAIVNVGDLEQFESGASVDQKALSKAGLVKGRFDGIKVLGQGELKKKLTVKAHKFSGSAKEAITKAGGSVEELPLMVHKPESAAKAHAGKGVKPA
ncbi:MAG: 50S ribosomal protein L15 [Myxococcaceae bacterium]|nr:50S ribosomal protein L15 [Myxococcaceae bacterium]